MGERAFYSRSFLFFGGGTCRRVEDHMRPLVRSAMRASAATERKEKKTTTTTTKDSNHKSQPSNASSLPTSNARRNSKAPVKEDAPSSTTARHDDDRPKEFATVSSAAPRRLNDIAMAPPELKKLPRGAATKRGGGGKAAKAGVQVLSMAQRVMMETERENAIRRYREMKERKVKESEGHDVDGG
jgi:hypothetical protein